MEKIKTVYHTSGTVLLKMPPSTDKMLPLAPAIVMLRVQVGQVWTTPHPQKALYAAPRGRDRLMVGPGSGQYG